MKNFEMHYPVEGATALRPRIEEVPAHRGNIIAFPGTSSVSVDTSNDSQLTRDFKNARHARKVSANPISHADKPQVKNRVLDTELVRNLRYGSAQGVSFNCMKRWQVIAVGCVFSAVAFATLFIGL